MQRGFAALAAVFLVVTMAAMGAFMLSFSNTQHLTSAQDLLGVRAYWAAQGGLEWGLAGATTTCPASPTSLTLEGYSVVITCSLTTYTEAGENRLIFVFQSTASSNAAVGTSGYIERSVSARLER